MSSPYRACTLAQALKGRNVDDEEGTAVTVLNTLGMKSPSPNVQAHMKELLREITGFGE